MNFLVGLGNEPAIMRHNKHEIYSPRLGVEYTGTICREENFLSIIAVHQNYLTSLKDILYNTYSTFQTKFAISTIFSTARTEPKVDFFALDHINHVRNVAGVECVGIGSSFDGIKQ